MTLSTVLFGIVGIPAVILTLLMYFVFKNTKSPFISFLQNYCGILFIFSGWVKAVDPLGTAYKMKDYFGEFESTFSESGLSFLAPMFPVLGEYSLGFAVAMIVFEIVLGLMLLTGAAPKFTSWAFLLLVGFFTFLTGFTYLTGYVPNEVNFFEFSKWGEFNENNMKVKDCGCFGDFIKLVPFTSFLKDVALLFPAFIFLFTQKKMHQFFNKPIRSGLLGVSLVGFILYCFSNFKWDIPHMDFRPFAKNVNVRQVKAKEAEAMAGVKITDWKMKNIETGKMITVPNAEYMGKDPEKNYKKYKGVYKVTDQIRTKPAIPATKISDFVIEDKDGNDLTEAILSSTEHNFLIVNYKLKGKGVEKTKTVIDSLFTVDTLQTDPLTIDRSFDKTVERLETYMDYEWESAYLQKHKILKPFTDAAKQRGIPVVMAIGGADEMTIADFNEDTGLDLTYGMADDILLKTIVRSNPGVVLFRDGKILDKWHIDKLPDFEKVAKAYLN